ncbi:hydroxyaromatic non-oxidative decarboxylase protein B [Klebsiella pneumoniae]|uniref:Hydroxyaromatic non-oxidative decarboxylase protein B n=1 Tax=Klebsiella pneumoniae TaxID=573 RepID=A0A447RPL1_KLEPN|nr:hydroxyaromatic non-oxidative decarboxylase protein B [Klebsiella pneumoniae]
MKLIIGMTGATGAPLGVALLQALRDMPEVETPSGDVEMGQNHHRAGNALDGARSGRAGGLFPQPGRPGRPPSSSGSFRTDGMIVIPCSMKTLAGIPRGLCRRTGGPRGGRGAQRGAQAGVGPAGNAAQHDPSGEHAGAVPAWAVAMVPPMPAYYNHPETVDDITNHIVTRVLDQFGLDYHKARRWNGLRHGRTICTGDRIMAF